ncbi:flavin reductase family protein [Blastococcus montanus]|uniref:flavin reductase family protein n=1 Tax=Blastococcus montanus TaxID=3144973 RepID=UPI00320A7449
MASVPTGVALLTCGEGSEADAMTVNCFVSVSLDPLLVMVGVGAAGRMRQRIEAAGGYAINVLTDAQSQLPVRFSRRDRPVGNPAMAELAAIPGHTGHPVLPAALCAMECSLEAVYPAGDHVLLLGRVLAIRSGPDGCMPLLFHRSRYGRVAH